MAASIFVVILNWNGRDDTLECLASVGSIHYENYEVVVVDNGSTDGSEEAIAAAFQNIVVLQTGENLGYAGGNNHGIRYALDQGADYILLLNNDTAVDGEVLSCLVNAAQDHPSAGIYGAKIYDWSLPDRLWFAGGQWQPSTMAFSHIGHGEPDGTQFSQSRECDYITGCALFAHADVFRSIGLLDEDFFLTYEETDWCYRAKKVGIPSRLVPTAKVWHKVSASMGGGGSPLQTYFMTRNRLYWGKKHLRRSQRIRLHLVCLRETLSALIPQFQLPDSGHSFLQRLSWSTATWLKAVRRMSNDPANKAMLLGFRDYYWGRLGDCPAAVRNLNSMSRSVPTAEPAPH